VTSRVVVFFKENFPSEARTLVDPRGGKAIDPKIAELSMNMIQLTYLSITLTNQKVKFSRT